MSVLNHTVSVYRNALSTLGQDVPLLTFLNSKRHIDEIQRIRAEIDHHRRGELKKMLPAATVSGTFSKRCIEGISKYNGLVCLDFDGINNTFSPEKMKYILSGFQEVAYVGLSASGTGTFCIVPTTNTKPALHARLVEILGSIMAAQGLIIDRACKDVCRLRFVSHDTAAYLNHEAMPFDGNRFFMDEELRPRPIRLQFGKKETVPTTGNIQERVEREIMRIETEKRDVTDNYADWVKIGFALASEFGPGGLEYFVRVSQFHPGFSREKTEKKYQQLCQQRKSVNIASFFHLIK